MDSGGHVPANLPRVLGTVDFPATQDDLVARAKEYGADQGILETLRRMPHRLYESMAEVLQRYRETQ